MALHRACVSRSPEGGGPCPGTPVRSCVIAPGVPTWAERAGSPTSVSARAASTPRAGAVAAVRRAGLLPALLLGAIAVSPAAAQPFPAKPIR